jgi:hypothetical protein
LKRPPTSNLSKLTKSKRKHNHSEKSRVQTAKQSEKSKE